MTTRKMTLEKFDPRSASAALVNALGDDLKRFQQANSLNLTLAPCRQRVALLVELLPHLTDPLAMSPATRQIVAEVERQAGQIAQRGRGKRYEQWQDQLAGVMAEIRLMTCLASQPNEHELAAALLLLDQRSSLVMTAAWTRLVGKSGPAAGKAAGRKLKPGSAAAVLALIRGKLALAVVAKREQHDDQEALQSARAVSLETP